VRACPLTRGNTPLRRSRLPLLADRDESWKDCEEEARTREVADAAGPVFVLLDRHTLKAKPPASAAATEDHGGRAARESGKLCASTCSPGDDRLLAHVPEVESEVDGTARRERSHRPSKVTRQEEGIGTVGDTGGSSGVYRGSILP
jgi:hypothetical protein